MDRLKAIFGEGAIDYDTFSKAVTEQGIKLADLSKGEYVSKNKYEDELKNKDTQITDLSGQLKQRDTDLQALQEQLNTTQGNSQELENVNKQLKALQKTYDTAKTEYEKQLAAQQMNFAVKEFASKLKFTSKAAKNQFISSMIEKNLTMENGSLVGANDYLEIYKNDNADSFVTDPEPQEESKPQFTQKTGTQTKVEDENPFLSAMHFTGVRKEK